MRGLSDGDMGDAYTTELTLKDEDAWAVQRWMRSQRWWLGEEVSQLSGGEESNEKVLRKYKWRTMTQNCKREIIAKTSRPRMRI